MSNFDVTNTQHAMALMLIIAELKAFNSTSDQAVGGAEALGLVPDDLDILKQELSAAVKLKVMHELGFTAPEGREKVEAALKVAEEIAQIALTADKTVEVLKERGLAKVDELEGKVVYDASFRDDEAVKASVQAETFARIKAFIGDANNEDNDEGINEATLEGVEAGGEFAAGEEQEEARDGAGDVQVSASVAA
jgi:hypothetical protein